jgi:TATA-box binding protein (TBP) (component of TFIID and TFIIIB)
LFLIHTLFFWTGKTVLTWKKLEDDLQRQLKDAQSVLTCSLVDVESFSLHALEALC